MHIVYVIAPFGGPEAYVQTLIPYLKSCGHQITAVYVNHPTPGQTTLDGQIPIYYVTWGTKHYYLSRMIGGYRLWASRLRTWELSLSVRQMLRQIDNQNPIDLVEVTEGILTRLLSQWPVVLRAHGSDWTVRDFCKDKPDKYDYLLKRDARRDLQQASKVSTISLHLADYLSFSCDFPRDLIEPIPYGIDCKLFSPQGLKVDFGKGPLLICIGRLEHRKGTDVLIRSLPIVWEQYSDLKVCFLGKEAEFTKDQLCAMVPESFREQLIFPGFVSHNILPQYYRSAAIYVAPTQYETFGYTILEAMSCGRPVISCPVGAVPELIKDGLNGSLVPFGEHILLAEAIVALLDNPSKCKSMGEMARHMVEPYSITSVTPQMESLYQLTKQSF